MFNTTKGKMRALTIALSIIFSLLFSLVSLVDTVIDTESFLGFSSSPQVWKLQAINRHGHQIPSSSSSCYTVPTHLDLGYRHHDWALNWADDRTYTNACTRKGYSCDSTGKIVSGGYDSWCNAKCRCTKLSPKSCLDQLAIYVNCVFNGENITGFDGPVIRNIYTAEDVGNDTSVLR